jgi:hypothetical protein
VQIDERTIKLTLPSPRQREQGRPVAGGRSVARGLPPLGMIDRIEGSLRGGAGRLARMRISRAEGILADAEGPRNHPVGRPPRAVDERKPRLIAGATGSREAAEGPRRVQRFESTGMTVPVLWCSGELGWCNGTGGGADVGAYQGPAVGPATSDRVSTDT